MSEEKRLKARVAHKHKTEAEWYLDVYTAAGSTTKRSDPFIPLGGELIIFDADENHEKRFKFGDGETDVIALPFLNNTVTSKQFQVLYDATHIRIRLNGQGTFIKNFEPTIFGLTCVAYDGVTVPGYGAIFYNNGEELFASVLIPGTKGNIGLILKPTHWDIDGEDLCLYLYDNSDSIIIYLDNISGFCHNFTLEKTDGIPEEAKEIIYNNITEDINKKLDANGWFISNDGCLISPTKGWNQHFSVDSGNLIFMEDGFWSGMSASEFYFDHGDIDGGTLYIRPDEIYHNGKTYTYPENSGVLATEEFVEETIENLSSNLSTASNLQNGDGANSIAQINAVAAGENSAALGISQGKTKEDGSYDLALSITKGYNDTTWYNTDENGSGATEDIVPIEPITEPEYYKDGTTEITSVHDITFTTTGAHGINSYSEGNDTLALGDYTHTEGYKTYAAARGSHAEGNMNVVFGVDSHSEGARNISVGQASHTEGMRNTALGKGSHIEGFKNQTGRKSTWSHIEGEQNLIKGMASHGEGAGNIIYDDIEIIEITNPDGSITKTEKNNIAYSHVEGYLNKVDASKAHAEGEANCVTAEAAHVEGKNNCVKGKYAHGEGYNNTVIGQSGHVEGASSAIAPDTITDADSAIAAYQAAIKKFNLALGLGSHSEGYNTLSLNSGSHSEGKETIAKGEASHTEGYRTEANAKYSHTEGIGTIANGNYVHVQGQYNIPAKMGFADIVGNGTADDRSNAYTLKWNGDAHHAGNVYVNSTWSTEDGTTTGGEKLTTESDVWAAINSLNIQNGSISGAIQQDSALATGQNAAAFNTSTASGKYSHAEGKNSSAQGESSHAEGANTIAIGGAAHAEGGGSTTAGALYSHAEGQGTLAMSKAQHTQGKFNREDAADVYAHIVGGGSGSGDRRNIHTVAWSGEGWFQGDVYVGSTSGKYQDEGSKRLATEEYVDNKFNGGGGSVEAISIIQLQSILG